MNQASLYKTPEGERAVRDFYDSVLARWPVPFRMIEVNTRQGMTSVLSCGAPVGPPLVLLHGAASNALMWIADVERLARHHHVLAVDVIGEPGRSAPTRPPWKGPAYSDWLSDVLDGLGLKTARLLGLSQGGWIALKLATTNPERVERLVLLCPGGVVNARLTFLLRALPLLLLGKRGIRSINRIVVSRQSIHPEALAFMDLILTHLRPRLDPAPVFSDDELRRLSMPVLLIGGEQDAILDCHALAARLQKHLARLEVHLLPETGHALVNVAHLIAPFLETPEEAASAQLA